MIKLILISMILFSSFAFSKVEPVIESTIDSKNLITVKVHNNTDATINCDWAISYFEDGLNYKRNFGSLEIAKQDLGVVTVSNDPYSKIRKLKTSFECE